MFMTPKAHDKSSIEQGNPEEDAYAFLKGVVDELHATGKLREDSGDPDLVAQAIWSAIHGVVSLEIAKCNDEWVPWRPVAERARVITDMIVRGLIKE